MYGKRENEKEEEEEGEEVLVVVIGWQRQGRDGRDSGRRRGEGNFINNASSEKTRPYCEIYVL